jgi:hypothetical protein
LSSTHPSGLEREILVPPTLGSQPLEALGASLAKGLGGGVEAVEDTGLLLEDQRLRLRVPRHDRPRGDVAGTKVLGQGTGNELTKGDRIDHRTSAPLSLPPRWSIGISPPGTAPSWR